MYADVKNTTPIAEPEPVQPASKTVQFDLTPRELSPEHESDKDKDRERERRREKKRDDRDDRRDRGRERRRDRDSDGSGRRRRDGSADSAGSDETIELPPRFDDFGRRKDDDPLAEKLESVLSRLLA